MWKRSTPQGLMAKLEVCGERGMSHMRFQGGLGIRESEDASHRERRQEKTFSELHKPFWTQLHLKAQ